MGWDGVPERRAASELGLMVEAGMSPAEALKSATSTAAYALGLDDLIGTIEPGKLADLLVVDGDPLEDLNVLLDADRINLVIQIGEPVAGTALEAAL
jgi:imidazolonepropionase-like amidohydrolase